MKTRIRYSALGAVVVCLATGLNCGPKRMVTADVLSPPIVTCTSNAQCNSAPQTRACSANNTCVGGHCVFATAGGCECWESNVSSCSVSGYFGACTKGQQVCSAAGQWGACQSIVSPLARDQCGVADDDNCDGIAHNGPLGGANPCQCIDGTACASGQTCTSGVCPVAPIPAPTQTCFEGTGCTAGATGECAVGRITCPAGPYGAPSCSPGSPNAEVCDKKDNDCNGVVDDVQGSHSNPVDDQTVQRNGNLFGITDNSMFGVSDCGGTRVSATATKLDGGDSHCEVVGWADAVCTNPKAKIGKSDFQDACKVFTQQGGKPGSNNVHDCRYIVHVGASSTNGIKFQASHVVSVQSVCP